jgi:hypothetical protein
MIKINDELELEFKPLPGTVKNLKYLGLILSKAQDSEQMIAMINAIEDSLKLTYTEEKVDEYISQIPFEIDGGTALFNQITQAIFSGFGVLKQEGK